MLAEAIVGDTRAYPRGCYSQHFESKQKLDTCRSKGYLDNISSSRSFKPIEPKNVILWELAFKLTACRQRAYFFEAIDDAEIDKAVQCAFELIRANVFSDDLFPEVSIDPYGEVCFTMRRPNGYVDVGINGAGEFSYHVRNDALGVSVFDDVNFKSAVIPEDFLSALREI